MKQDLFHAIALHGQVCGEVVAVEKQAENDFLATCRSGNRYRVWVTPDGSISVDHLTAKATGEARETSHDELVKRDLHSIIHLAGHDCGRVVDVERQDRTDHLVACDNGDRFRVHVTPAGRVSVQKHAQAGETGQESAVDVVAAAVRARGHTCENPTTVQRDVERSTPDEAAWAIQCENGAFRVKFMGDAGATVEPMPRQ